VAWVVGIVEERLNCCVNDTEEEDWHDDEVLYEDETVLLLAGAGLGHHEECDKEDEDDAYEEDDVACATEVIPRLKIGAGWVRPNPTDDCADETNHNKETEKTNWLEIFRKTGIITFVNANPPISFRLYRNRYTISE